MSKRRQIRELARRRVEAVWACLAVLCPELDIAKKKVLAGQVLDLSRGESPEEPEIRITSAQVTEMVWRNFHCINPYCSALLYAREIAEELNLFFNPEDE